MEQQRFAGNAYRATVVCVDEYRDGVPEGSFYNPGMPGPVHFSSLSQLLMRMDEMLEGMRFPQAYTILRSFSEGETSPPADAAPPETPREGRLATFTVRVLFRQNASWQGTVLWQEQNRDESFRSVLELVFLMDSALRQSNERQVN